MTTWLGQVAAAPAGDGESGWRGGRSDGGLQGDLVAESLQLADMVALAAVGVDTGVVEAGSPPSPRGHELSYDQADWLTRQLDLGTDGTCNQDDRRITNSFWATGWERQRDTDKANSACAWAGKQTTTWTHFDNGKLKTLETLANRGGTDELTKSHEVGYLDNGVYVNGHRVSDHYLLKRQEGNTATTCVCRRPPPVTAGRHRDPGGQRHHRGRRRPAARAPLSGQPAHRARHRRHCRRQVLVRPAGQPGLRHRAAGSQGDCSPSDGAGVSANLLVDHAYDYLDRLAASRSYAGAASPTDRPTTPTTPTATGWP